jgi:DNA-binding NtrC family response regulator
LRERREELPELIEGFMTIFRSRFRRPALKLSHEARRRLQEHNWPGNVRELRNCLERACALSTEDLIEEERLGLGHNGSLHVIERPPFEEVHVRPLSLVGTRMRLADLERAHLLSILEEHGGNRERAAEVLGISARTLYRKLREYEIDERAEEVA